MGGAFGKSKPKKRAVSAHDQAVLDLKVQRDKVKQYQRKVSFKTQTSCAIFLFLIPSSLLNRSRGRAVEQEVR